MSEGARFAKDITLRVTARGVVFTIDGEDFPWVIAADPPPQVGPAGTGYMPSVTVTLLAERVHYEHGEQ